MALGQKGANYQNRANIKDQYTLGALDDLATQIQAVVTQGNFSKLGTPTPPSAPTALQVTPANGLYSVAISHANAKAGTRWILEYSRSPQFSNSVTVDLGESKTWENYLPNQRLYFRAAAKFLASSPSAWTYFGSPASPQAV